MLTTGRAAETLLECHLSHTRREVVSVQRGRVIAGIKEGQDGEEVGGEVAEQISGGVLGLAG